MADVFVSYKAEDRRRVRRLVEALEKDGFSVWWDAHVGAGEQWRETIASELDTAKCVVVAWSKRSVAPDGRFVRDEAARALRRGVYLPFKLDDVDPPLGFGEAQAIRLVDWDGNPAAPAYRALLSSVRAVVRGEKPERVDAEGEGRTSRRNVLAAGGVATAALVSGAGWWWLRRDKLSPEAEKLYEEAAEGVQDSGVEANANAIGKLRRAAELEPKSAAVWGLLALAYVQQSSVAPAIERQSLTSRGLASAARAEALERFQPEALAARIAAMTLFKNWFAIEQSCRSALERHPDNPYLLQRLAMTLAQVGRHEECLPLNKRVAESFSVPFVHVGQIMLLWNLGRLDEAEAEIERALSLWPRHYAVWFTRFYYLLYSGRPSEALALIGKVAARPVGIPAWNFRLVTAQAEALVDSGPAKIGAALRGLEEAAHKASGFAENAAIFAAFVGATDDAFKILTGLYTNRGFAVGDSWFSDEQAIYLGSERNTYFLFNQTMKSVRHDPRYRHLTRKIGLEDYWRRTGSLGRVIR